MRKSAVDIWTIEHRIHAALSGIRILSMRNPKKIPDPDE